MCELSSMFLMLLFHLLLLAWVEARLSHFFLSLFLVFTSRLTARLFLNLFGVRMLPPGRDYWPPCLPGIMASAVWHVGSPPEFSFLVFLVKKTKQTLKLFYFTCLYSGRCLRPSFALLCFI